MTLKKQANSSSESSSGSSSGSSSSSSSSSSSGSASSSSESDSSSESPKPRGPPPAPPPAPSARPPQDKAVNNKARGAAAPASHAAQPGAAAAAAPAGPPPPPARPAPPRRRSSAKQQRPARPRAPDKPPPDKPLKKKSIFSPDNSTESESEANDVAKPAPTKPPPKPTPPVQNNKQKGKRPKTSTSAGDKAKPAPPADVKPKEPESTAKTKKAVAPKKSPPVRKKIEKETETKYPSKETVSSCTSTNTESTASASSSDSDSSAPSVKTPAPKRAAVVAAKLGRSAPLKVEPVKTDKNTPSSKDAPVPPCTDSDVENTKPANNASNVTRKLTRSASARKSRHVVGKAANSDTESETELGPTKRSLSKSPIKRTTNSSKGPPPSLCPVKGRPSSMTGPMPGLGTGAVPRGGQPTVPSSPRCSLPEKEQELRCMLPGCDSLGHLSGRLDRHFTIEACPIYHNLTAESCIKSAAGTRALQETRRRAQHALAARRTSQPSLEHRAYQLKIKDLRAKLKLPNATSTSTTTTTTTTSSTTITATATTTTTTTTTTNSTIIPKQEKLEGPCKTTWTNQHEAESIGEREPILTGFVPDYDLSLFREAQAAAAFKIEEELKNMPPSKGTRYVCMGKYRMEAWYQSPYPPDAARLPQLYLCEFCLNHHKTVTGITRHRAKCVWRHPPGDEVYRKGRLGVWQVDGRRHKQYCQQLCLLAKFFLDHKTLYYDVEPFLFYVMTLADGEGCHTVGYFSKEKNSLQNYNVSCILTLPPYQRQGYGRLLIDFSYLLTRVEGKIGSPEKPLSDLGLISYRSYWKDVLLQYLCDHPGSTLSIRDLSQEMAINSYDIVSTLQALGMMKYWKGKHIILKRQDVLDEYIERTKRRGQVKQIDRACLKWTPFVPPSSQGGG